VVIEFQTPGEGQYFGTVHGHAIDAGNTSERVNREKSEKSSYK